MKPNPKSETSPSRSALPSGLYALRAGSRAGGRNPKQTRNPNAETAPRAVPPEGFRHSSFVIRHLKFLLLPWLALPGVLPAQSATNLLVNGDFSQGSADRTAVPGWTSPTGAYPRGYTDSNGMNCLPSQGSNPYLQIEAPSYTDAYVEQAVTLPAGPARLSVRTWGQLDPTTTISSIVDAAHAVHVLEQFVEPSLEAFVSGNLGCSGAVPVTKAYDLSAFAGQTVKVRLETTAPGVNGTITDFDDVSVVALTPVYWRGGVGNWSGAAKWSPSPPTSDDAVVLQAGAVVNLDAPDAQIGALTVGAGSTVNVQLGAALAAYGPLLNNGTMNLSGDVTSYAPGNAVVQNGALTIDSGVAMRGLDCGGNDLAFVQTGGSVTIDGSFQTWNPSVQDGSFSVGAARAEGFRERRTVHQQLEPPRLARRLPVRHPVLRAHKHMVIARLRKCHGGGRVFDRTAQAMREQVRRPHDLDELRVEHPAAVVHETLGLNENAGGEGWRRQGEDQQEQAPPHQAAPDREASRGKGQEAGKRFHAMAMTDRARLPACAQTASARAAPLGRAG